MISLKEIQKKFTPVLKEKGVERAIVFGSYGRDEADEFSDLDLLIVTETKLPFVERYRDFWALFIISPTALEMFVYTSEEFERMKREQNPFITTVLEEGKEIYEK